MFNTSGLETPPWSTNIHKTHAMVLLNKEKSASLEDKKPISAGKFAPTSPPACLQQSDLITIPGQSTLLVVQIATTLARFLWCGALKMNLCSWPLSLHSSRISSHDKASGEQNPDLVSGPRHLARSISYSFFGVGRCHRDLPHIRFQLRSGSLSRKWLEQVGRELLAGDSNTRLIATGDGRTGVHNHFASVKYIIFTEAVVAVNESRVYVSTVSWCSTGNMTMAIASSFSADRSPISVASANHLPLAHDSLPPHQQSRYFPPPSDQVAQNFLLSSLSFPRGCQPGRENDLSVRLTVLHSSHERHRSISPQPRGRI
jgi:hypothetical protein